MPWLETSPITAFRHLYNEERPHQALQGRTPASLYRPSPRSYLGTLPPVEYPGHFIVKHVTNAGTIRFKKRLVFLADGIWSIHLFRRLRTDRRTRLYHQDLRAPCHPC